MTQRPDAADERSMQRSHDLAERARKVIPGGSQTGSKAPDQFVRDVCPTHLERGQGSHIWDVDGNEYVDYPMALGPVVLGHNYEPVTEAVESQLDEGTMFSMPHRLQVEAAELFTDVVPCAEMVRFAKNGNDVTTVAAKIARAYTGRDVIATQGYHGWSNTWMGSTPLNAGIPEGDGAKTERFDYNDVESLERIFEEHPDDVAAIVTTAINATPPEDDFVQRMREIADREGALLVFDEVLTGFRFAPGGAQEYFDVTPDLGCFAKGMANGFPISAVAGREDVMRTIERDDFFYSMTYAGEALSLAATKACLEIHQSEPVHEHIRGVGETLRDEYNVLAEQYGVADHTSANGVGPHFRVDFDLEGDEGSNLAKSLFMQECFDRGVFFTGNHLPSYSHTDEDVEFTLEAYEGAMAELADAIDDGDVESRLDGAPVGATVRERTGDDE